MAIVQEFRELLTQAFVALAAMARNDGVLEQFLLDRHRQFGPHMRDGLAQGQHEALVGGVARRGIAHDQPARRMPPSSSAASTSASGAIAGALSTSPSTPNCEPWHGQSQQRSKEFQ